jgi:hypothetical protein
MSEMQILLVVVGCTVAGAAVLMLVFARVRTDQAQDSWRKLADRHGLRYATEWEGKKKLVVHGDLDGRSFRMENVEVGGGQQKQLHTKITFHLGRRLPAGLFLGPERFGKGVFKKMIVGEEIEIGDAAFDEKVVIRGDDPGKVKAYLTDERKAAVLKILEMKATVEGGMIIMEAPREIHDLSELERHLQEMRSAAGVLDPRL